jgi:hypothetical protein
MATPWPEIKAAKVTVDTTLAFPNRITTSNLPLGGNDQILLSGPTGIPSYNNGSDGQTLQTIGTSVTWQSLTWSYGFGYYTFIAQNFNLSTTNTLSFTSTLQSSAWAGVTSYTAPNTVSSKVVRFNSARYYKVTMAGTLNNPGATAVAVQLNVLINGAIVGAGPIVNVNPGETESFYGFIFINPAVNDTISFRSTRISGTTALNSDAVNSVCSIELVQTYQ